jgi:transcriptional regulator with XRE-family HTH domain
MLMKTSSITLKVQKRLRTLREERKLTQEKLAQKAGISLYYLQLLEGKKPKNPSLLVLEKLSKAFEMPVWQLVKFDD